MNFPKSCQDQQLLLFLAIALLVILSCGYDSLSAQVRPDAEIVLHGISSQDTLIPQRRKINELSIPADNSIHQVHYLVYVDKNKNNTYDKGEEQPSSPVSLEVDCPDECANCSTLGPDTGLTDSTGVISFSWYAADCVGLFKVTNTALPESSALTIMQTESVDDQRGVLTPKPPRKPVSPLDPNNAFQFNAPSAWGCFIGSTPSIP